MKITQRRSGNVQYSKKLLELGWKIEDCIQHCYQVYILQQQQQQQQIFTDCQTNTVR